MDWAQRAEAAIARYRDGERRLDGTDDDPRQRQLTRLGNTAWAAGLCLLMAGLQPESAAWLRRAAERYRESWEEAPPDSWGRPIGAMKALLLAGDDATVAAQWALDAGAAEAASPIGAYAGTLALLVLGRDVDARVLGLDPSRARRLPAGRRRRARDRRRGRRRRLSRRDRGCPPVVRDAHRLPRGRRRRRHGARAATAGRAARRRRQPASVPAASGPGIPVARTGHEVHTHSQR